MGNSREQWLPLLFFQGVGIGVYEQRSYLDSVVHQRAWTEREPLWSNTAKIRAFLLGAVQLLLDGCIVCAAAGICAASILQPFRQYDRH